MFKREQDEFLDKERIECEECRKLEMEKTQKGQFYELISSFLTEQGCEQVEIPPCSEQYIHQPACSPNLPCSWGFALLVVETTIAQYKIPLLFLVFPCRAIYPMS